jgi:hypothetical protein
MNSMKLVRTAVVLSVVYLSLTAPAFAAGDDWRKLSPKEKDRIIRNYERWEKLPPKDKEHLREEWNRWNNMSEDRRDQLKRRFDDRRRD